MTRADFKEVNRFIAYLEQLPPTDVRSKRLLDELLILLQLVPQPKGA